MAENARVGGDEVRGAFLSSWGFIVKDLTKIKYFVRFKNEKEKRIYSICAQLSPMNEHVNNLFNVTSITAFVKKQNPMTIFTHFTCPKSHFRITAFTLGSSIACPPAEDICYDNPPQFVSDSCYDYNLKVSAASDATVIATVYLRRLPVDMTC